jgi:hypothetical protein
MEKSCVYSAVAVQILMTFIYNSGLQEELATRVYGNTFKVG